MGSASAHAVPAAAHAATAIRAAAAHIDEPFRQLMDYDCCFFVASLLKQLGDKEATHFGLRFGEKFPLKKLIRMAEIIADDDFVLTDFPLHEGLHAQHH